MKKVIGIDLGGSKIRLIGMDSRAKVFRKQIFGTLKESFEKIFDQLIKVIKENLTAEIKAIGIGVAGPVDSNKIIVACPNLPGFERRPLAELIEKVIHLPVIMDNDANCALLSEMWLGTGKNQKNIFLVTLGTGIGGSLAIDGRIYHGNNQIAGEFGHTIIDPAGPKCKCGQKGCLEAFWQKRINEDRYLAIGLVNIYRINTPDIIVVSGGVASDKKIESINKEIKKIIGHNLPLKKGKLGQWAGAIGAAKLAMNYGT